MRKLLEDIGGRRFLLCMFSVVAPTALVWFAKITPDVYQWLILGIAGIYVSGNTAQKVLPGQPGAPRNE